MSKTFVSAIKDRDPVDSVFLVKDKIIAMAKNGKPYMNLKLMDKSGEIEAKVWDNVDVLGGVFEKDDFVAVKGKASIYLNKMQLVVAELKRIPESAIQLADFLPTTLRDIAEMEGELGALVSSLKDPHLRTMMESFLSDTVFMEGYRTAPAAKGMHHVYLGGLLEHSLAVAKLADTILPLYAPLNRDLLLVGALLHDIGKVREMVYLRSFDYTDEGKLIGHITIGVEMIQEKIAAIPGFPLETAILLKHMMLSHHGQYEYGSPKRPKTMEATILNYLDDLDAKINGIRTHVGKEPESSSRWSSYHKLYDRYFFKGVPENPDEILEAAPPPAPLHIPPQQAVKEKPGFHNNPFTNLKNENLDLF